LGHNVKNLIKIVSEDPISFFTDSDFISEEDEYFEKLKKINIEFKIFNEEILKNLEPYLLYDKLYVYEYKDVNFKYYKKLFNILPHYEIENLKEIRNIDISTKEYEKYIDVLYREWLNIENRES
jgi:hypothetical protein